MCSLSKVVQFCKLLIPKKKKSQPSRSFVLRLVFPRVDSVSRTTLTWQMSPVKNLCQVEAITFSIAFLQAFPHCTLVLALLKRKQKRTPGSQAKLIPTNIPI